MDRTYELHEQEYRDAVTELSRRVRRVLEEMREERPAVFLNPPITPDLFWIPGSPMAILHEKLKRDLGDHYRLVNDPEEAAHVWIHLLGINNDLNTWNKFKMSAADDDKTKYSIALIEGDESIKISFAERSPNFRYLSLTPEKQYRDVWAYLSDAIKTLFPCRSRQTKVYVICSDPTDRDSSTFKDLEEKLKDLDQDKNAGNELIFHLGPYKVEQSKFLSKVDATLVVWQGGGKLWFSPQFRELVHADRVRPPQKPMAASGVCLMPPPKLMEEIDRDLKRSILEQFRGERPLNFCEINYLDLDNNEKAEQVKQAVERFLEPLRAIRAARR